MSIGSDYYSILSASQIVYVQVYDTDLAAKSDTSAPPAGVQQYQTASGTVNSILQGGNGLLDLVNRLIGFILGLFQEFIYAVFFWLIAPMIQSMLSIHPYTDTFVSVIYPGWEVIRNLCNIFFIMALIIIAMATLFRVESYKFKDLIIQLIIAALLVNFSLVIGQAVLGLADTVQAQFLPANVSVIRSLAGDLMVNAYRQDVYKSDFGSQGSFSATIKPIFLFAMSLGRFAVFCAIAVFLVVRIIALWLLLMISPIAYAVGVLPATSKYRGEWWSNFLKYAFFTPIMAFFLNMAAIISNASQKIPVLQTVGAGSLAKDLGNDDLANFVFKVASNILLLVFLLVALKVAESAGIYGASGITEIAKKGIFAPFVGTQFLAKAAAGSIKKQYDKKTDSLASGGWFARQAFKVLQPVATVKAIREESKQERELYSGRIGASATKVARKQFGWRRTTEDPTYLFDEHKGKELYEQEEGKWSPNEQINMGKINRLAEEAKAGDLRAKIKLKYAIAEAFRNRNLNEALEGSNGIAARKLGGALNYNSDNIRYFFQQMTKEGYLDEDFTREFLKDLGTDAYSTGDYNGAELVYSDPETGHAHLIEMGPRGEDGNSKPVGWDEYVKKRTAFIDQADIQGKKNAIVVGKASAAKKAKASASPTDTQADIDAVALSMEADEIHNAEGVEIAKVLKALEEAEAGKHHGHNPYANSMHAERGRNYMKINLSKKKGNQQLDMFHDSIINIGVADGEAHVSDAGSQILGKLDEQGMFALLRDNMPPKTKDKFKVYSKGILRNPKKGLEKIENDITKIVVDEYREQGVHLDKDTLETEVKARRNMWLAASAGLASGQQAVTIMQTFKAQAGEDNSTKAGKDALAERIKNDYLEMIKKSQK